MARARNVLLVTFTSFMSFGVWATSARSGEAPAPLTDAERAIFDGSAEDKLDKPVCSPEEETRATAHCRDQVHYVHANEWHHDVYHPYVDGIGGGYVGVGSDQGLTFVAFARSELAWLIDYDEVVVAVNRIHRAFVLHADDSAAFLKLWDRKASGAEAHALLEKEYGTRPDYKRISAAYDTFASQILETLTKMQLRRIERPSRHWLETPADYQYVREMFRRGRIRIMGGDLLKSTSLIGIGEAARKLNVPMRIVYLSNAEEFWPYPKEFRDNFTRMTMDERSVVLRTFHKPTYGPILGDYNYVIEDGRDFQRRLADPATRGVWSVMQANTKTARVGVVTIGRAPVEPPKVASKKPTAPTPKD